MHKSLVNLDKIEALIMKHRALIYPYGQDIAAVEYEYRMRHKDREDAVSISNVLITYYTCIHNLL